MAKKTDELTWFRVHAANREALEVIPDEILGKAFKAAMRYFADGNDAEIESGMTGENDKLTLVAYKLLKTGIDESVAAHEVFRASGKKGADKRKANAEEKKVALAAALEKYGAAEPEPKLVTQWQDV